MKTLYRGDRLEEIKRHMKEKEPREGGKTAG